MKCNVCGTNLPKGTTRCYTCGNIVNENAADEIYTGPTKSKALAGFLMVLGIGDLYLLDFGRYVYKWIFSLFTCGLGGVVLNIKDAIKIFSGEINCDTKGRPLV